MPQLYQYVNNILQLSEDNCGEERYYYTNKKYHGHCSIHVNTRLF